MDANDFIASAPVPVIVSLVLTMVMAAAKRVPFIPDWMIPFMAFSLGAVVYTSLSGFTAKNFMIGIVVGGSSVGLNQLWRQSVDRIKTGPESSETQEFRRRLSEVVDQKVAAASQSGQPQSVTVSNDKQSTTVKKEEEKT